MPRLLLAASFAPWSPASATSAAAALWQAAEPGPARAWAPSGSTGWSAEGRLRVQRSRWRGRTLRRQEAARGEVAPTTIPRKDPSLVATLHVLPYDDPRAGDCSCNRGRLKALTSLERRPRKAAFHRQAALGGRENRNAFARPVVETQDMKKRLFIILLVIAALLLAGLGTIIGTGGD